MRALTTPETMTALEYAVVIATLQYALAEVGKIAELKRPRRAKEEGADAS